MAGIAAGITLYNPELERLTANVNSISAQTDFVYLIDNGSDNVDKVKALFSENEKIRIIENRKNEGIARALNQMCEEAFQDGYEWILTLDQDSVAEDEMIKKYSRYIGIENAAIITPYFNDENEADLVRSSIKPYEQVHRCNTSASLTKLSAWKTVGGFDERMFIDCVDFDFCTLLEEAGYIIIRDNEAELHHVLGHATEVRFFMPIARILHIKKLKAPMYTYNHSPLRTYYYARNIRYYMYKHRNFIDMNTERRVYLKWFVLKVFFEKNKIEKLKAICRGRRDAKAIIKELRAQGK